MLWNRQKQMFTRKTMITTVSQSQIIVIQSQCLLEETLKAVGPFSMVSIPGVPSRSSHQSTLEMCNLSWTPYSSLEKDNNSLNHSCVRPKMRCLE